MIHYTFEMAFFSLLREKMYHKKRKKAFYDTLVWANRRDVS